jgi:Nucleoside-diphosphate-sugar pyrophosphorylase involved in lipopolysaccharide biosynthesis/translation initiation factor 2B, gamma/epsilon subunits (eIF-2Bgamma/eIF-2Bepsilon)
MKAMIFAAGLGSRLAPLTDNCPKALLPVAGVPMIERAVNLLRDFASVDRIVVNVHSHADMIEKWASKNAGSLGVEIVLSDERNQLLDTGGGLLYAHRLLEDDVCDQDPIILYNADIVTDVDLRQMLEAHCASEADVTLLTSDRATSRKLLFDSSGRMKGWINYKTGEMRPSDISKSPETLIPLAFGGIHIISLRLFPFLRDYAGCVGQVFSITPFYIEMCSRLKIMSWTQPAGTRWIDAGKPDTYVEANRQWC